MEQMLKFCSLLLFNFPLSLSLTAIDLGTTLLTLSRHLDLSLSLSPFHSPTLGSLLLLWLFLSPFWLLVSGCGSTDCNDGIQVSCFFFLRWRWVYLIFTCGCFLVGFWDDFCCKFSWIWVVVMVASGFGLWNNFLLGLWVVE